MKAKQRQDKTNGEKQLRNKIKYKIKVISIDQNYIYLIYSLQNGCKFSIKRQKMITDTPLHLEHF